MNDVENNVILNRSREESDKLVTGYTLHVLAVDGNDLIAHLTEYERKSKGREEEEK